MYVYINVEKTYDLPVNEEVTTVAAVHTFLYCIYDRQQLKPHLLYHDIAIWHHRVVLGMVTLQCSLFDHITIKDLIYKIY